MYFLFFALTLCFDFAVCMDVEITGELAFDFHIRGMTARVQQGRRRVHAARAAPAPGPPPRAAQNELDTKEENNNRPHTVEKLKSDDKEIGNNSSSKEKGNEENGEIDIIENKTKEQDTDEQDRNEQESTEEDTKKQNTEKQAREKQETEEQDTTEQSTNEQDTMEQGSKSQDTNEKDAKVKIIKKELTKQMKLDDFKLEDIDLEDTKEEGIDIQTARSDESAEGGGAQSKACMYRLPRAKQVDAMLSDMMNQLTRVFIRMENYMRGAGRRGPRARRPHLKRYRVVDKKGADFFETIFANMTEEFRLYLNATTSGAARAGLDPCRHQPEMKKLWSELLDHAQTSYWKAALRCVDELMGGVAGARRGRTGSARRLRRVLLRRAAPQRSLRARHLALLCRRFHVCYYDLL